MWCIIGEGEFDFYMFQPDEDELPDPRIMDDSTLRFFMDASFQSETPPVIPRSPRSPPVVPEDELVPMYRVIPFVKKTEIPLNIQRKHLEDYMDR